MRILWFTNTPCGASEKLSSKQISGGWLSALESKISKYTEVSLFVCFYWHEAIKPFVHGQTTYIPVATDSRIKRFENFIREQIVQTKRTALNIQPLLEVIGEVQPDIIHVHGTEYNFGLVQEYTNVPVIISIQGLVTQCAEKYFAGVSVTKSILFENKKTLFSIRSYLATYASFQKRSAVEKRILHNSRHIIGRTRWDYEITRLLSPDSTYYQGEELLRPEFYSKQWHPIHDTSKYRIVTTMSGGLYKGLETLVDAANYLVIHTNINFEWIVIGQNEEDSLPELIKKWKNVNYGDLNIQFVGKQNAKEIVNYLISSHLFCQVSHIENSPNSVCEAMVLGTPVIASCAGGTDSLLENQKEGKLFPPGDAYALAGALLQAIRTPKQTAIWSKNARQRALNRHNPDSIVNCLVEIYDKIVKQ